MAAKHITVIGFGGLAPPKILQILAENRDASVKLVRSPAIQSTLLSPPYRTFLLPTSNEDADSDEICIYNIPTSLGEYASSFGLSESHMFRTKLYSCNVAGLVYNHSTGELSGSVPSLPTSYSSLRKAALVALSKLDELQTSDETAVEETVIVVGGGGREHAIALALAKSPHVGKVLCCPGNGGTCSSNPKIVNVEGRSQSNDDVIELINESGSKLVVVGPEAPLVDGIVDAIRDKFGESVLTFGCSQAASILEASKAFTKDFLKEHGIPSASYRSFTDMASAVDYVKSLSEKERVVVKASGLAAGKGVLLPTTREETVEAVHTIMGDKAFGSAGDTCVIESYLVGPEASCLAFCDGKTAKLMPAAQDHKRALDNDEGLNTGGMGAYAPAPCVTPKLQEQILGFCQKTVEEMANAGMPYVGVLYAGVILTPDGPYILEYNCRFGDPETQVVLPLLETDLYEIFVACCTGNLSKVDVRFKDNTSAATVVCAAKGYPETYNKGMVITGLAECQQDDSITVYHAGTKVVKNDDGITNVCCSGGRVLAVTGIGTNLSDALKKSYSSVKKIDFEGSQMHYRTDIAKGAVQRKLRIGVLGSTRGTALTPVIDACSSGKINAEIVCIVSNRSKAPILEKASLIPNCFSQFVSAKSSATQEEYDAECSSIMLSCGVDLILCVGYMRILSKKFTDLWHGKCLNVHPSLLPLHAGGMDLAVHQSVLDAGEKQSGCTIHEVTQIVDGGPIVVQKVVKVDDGETAESLKVKVQKEEGAAFIEAISKYTPKTSLTYADAGVSIESGNELVERIKPYCKKTSRPGCDAQLGGFGGLFDLSAAGYGNDAILIGATDGVGTKLRIAQAVQKHDTIGIDLVAMCVNDLIVAGGEPLFFLDYYATGKLTIEVASEVVKGIADGCVQSGCGLIGGETAEMPSMYSADKYDLAGFSVGAVKRGCILPQNVSAGDVLLAISSSGIHSNGFSLVRKLIEKAGLSYFDPCPWEKEVNGKCPTIGESLLTPTSIYVKNCLPLLKADGLIHAMAHITGGGLLENLPRSLPNGLNAEITYHPPLPPVFAWLKQESGLCDSDMLTTFNCGIGMVLIVDGARVEEAKNILQESFAPSSKMEMYEIGSVQAGSQTNSHSAEVIMKCQLS